MLIFLMTHRCSPQKIGKLFSELYRCYTEAILYLNLITDIEVELKSEVYYNNTAATVHIQNVSFLGIFVEAEAKLQISVWVFPIAVVDLNLRADVARRHVVNFSGALLTGAHHSAV